LKEVNAFKREAEIRRERKRKERLEREARERRRQQERAEAERLRREQEAWRQHRAQEERRREEHRRQREEWEARWEPTDSQQRCYDSYDDHYQQERERERQEKARRERERWEQEQRARSRPKRRVGPDHYAILGVSEDADDAAVKKAWRKLSMEHHPDKVKQRGGDEQEVAEANERTQQVNGAYRVLSNSLSRREYNENYEYY